MTISLENYIIYIVDYYDGILSPNEQDELFAFLDLNPVQKEEFNSFGQSKRVGFPEKSIGTDFKHQLKKICTEPMGRVTRNNVELYLTKEIEGELTQVEKIELADFIKQNPIFGRDRNLYKLAKVNADEHIFLSKLNKQVLKKIATIVTAGISKGNIDEWMILYCERQLTISQEKELLAFISLNPVYQKDLELYKLTYLQPEKKIIFKEKSGLYLKAIRPLYMRLVPYMSAAVAACLIVYFSFNNSELGSENNIIIPTAQKENIKSSKQEQIKSPFLNPVVATFANNGSPNRSLSHNKNLAEQESVIANANTNHIIAKTDSSKPVEFNLVRLDNIANSQEDMELENRIKQRLLEEEFQASQSMQEQKVVQVSGNGNPKVNWDQVARRATNWVNKNTKFKVNVSKNIPQNINSKPIIIGNTIFFGDF